LLNSTDDLIPVTQYIGLNEYENQDIYTVSSNPNTCILAIIKSITHEKTGIQMFNVPVLKIDTINLKDIPA